MRGETTRRIRSEKGGKEAASSVRSFYLWWWWGGWCRASPAADVEADARDGKEDVDRRLDPRAYEPAAGCGGGISFSAGADECRWILTPTPFCRRCADGAVAADESRRQRDRLLCPHCSSTSPTTAPPPPPVELGEVVSDESEVWWWSRWAWWSRAGLRPAADDDKGGGCGARARSGLDS